MTTENQTTAEVVSADPADQATEAATQQTESHETAPTDAEKAQKALQRRIDRLTREKYELKAQNDQLRTPKQQADDKEHLTDDEVETRAEVRAREIAELNQFNAQCNEVFEKGVKANKEFAKSFKDLSEEIGQPFDAKGKPTAVMSAILDADEPHKLILHLADNPELASELADLSPTKQIRRIAQIEKEMSEDATPKQSNAPKPVQPVKGSSGAPKEPDPKDTKAWIAWENEKLLASRTRK